MQMIEHWLYYIMYYFISSFTRLINHELHTQYSGAMHLKIVQNFKDHKNNLMLSSEHEGGSSKLILMINLFND